MQNIRNFAIIAHVDHGKSTLADRLMELTGTVEKNQHEEQMLDRNPISRERGITIKLAPVRMNYVASRHSRESGNPKNHIDSGSPAGMTGKDEYILNLIDTPGHVDFSYEVDRTLSCVEGVILLVDATQGIQAQTISNAHKALEKNLVIIPAINKIDMPSAQVTETKQALVDFLGVREDEIMEISAKTGQNVEQVLERIVSDIPAPTLRHAELGSASVDMNGSRIKSGMTDELKALIFDSYYDPHKGVVSFVRIFNGSVTKNERLNLIIGNRSFQSLEVGIFTPDLLQKESLTSGEIGYIVTNLKDIRDVRVGDTVSNKKENAPLPGYRKVKPMVFASLFPTDTVDYEHLTKALEKIYLTDSSLEFNAIYSQALGPGYRVGFLGLLHADVVRERLEREYDLSLLLTPPQVDYRKVNDRYEEPIVRISVITPPAYIGAVTQVCEQHRARFITMDNKHQVYMEYEMPLAEMISDFFDTLKSVTSGYASFDWEFLRYEAVNADKLSLLLNGEEVEEFSEIVVADRAQEKGQYITKKLKELIPRQQFEVRIQAHYKGRIISSERVAPFRKDVLIKSGKMVGGGDYSRKRKLLEKQKKGKNRMKSIGNVEIPKEAF
ncbi:MAG: translation elongation factor 4, partial [Candidatus Roizmanbacteria bacterium]|nr:translation elongation factor 4 [Candidatus Roizmanbacteria bacterium]